MKRLIFILLVLLSGCSTNTTLTTVPTQTPQVILEELPPPQLVFDGTHTVSSTLSWFSWSLIDMRDGKQWGSSNTEPNVSASMIKAWLAADFLHMNVESSRTPTQSELKTLEKMIRDSDNEAASWVYSRVGGSVTLNRMNELCGSFDQTYTVGGWGGTRITARDAALMARCIADGRAATPYWTPWLLDMMRKVRGVGDFGIRHSFKDPEKSLVAIKNGWVPSGGVWYINCLAIGWDWVLVVETRSKNFTQGSQGCLDIANQLRSV